MTLASGLSQHQGFVTGLIGAGVFVLLGAVIFIAQVRERRQRSREGLR